MQQIRLRLRSQDTLRTQDFDEESYSLFGDLTHSWTGIDEGIILHIADYTALSDFSISNDRSGFLCFEIALQKDYSRKIEDIENAGQIGAVLINNSPSAEYRIRVGNVARGIIIYCDRKRFMSKFQLDISRIQERSRSIFLSEYGSFDTLKIPLCSSTMIDVEQIIDCHFSDPLRAIFLASKVNEILCALVAQIGELGGGAWLSVPGGSEDRLIEAAAAIYRRELHNPPTIEKLADRVGVDKRRLIKGFRDILGTTPHAFQLQQRMEHAELLLRDGAMSISEVGRLVGYQGYRTFVRAYHAYHGRSPSRGVDKRPEMRADTFSGPA
ncbi:helix-turn-helix domain-containing protein [Sphingopyxis fribergensis]